MHGLISCDLACVPAEQGKLKVKFDRNRIVMAQTALSLTLSCLPLYGRLMESGEDEIGRHSAISHHGDNRAIVDVIIKICP